MAITVHTSLEDLPRRLRSFGDQIPYATSLALNDAGFGLMREEKSQLGQQITLRNTWTQRGIRVLKSNKSNLQVEVGHTRWYIESLIEGGARHARQGYRYEGKRYLIVPAAGQKTATGKLRRIPSGAEPFVIKEGDHNILAYRKAGGRRSSLVVIGLLVLETDYKAKTYDHEGVAQDYLNQNWPRHWLAGMERAAASAR